MEILTWALLILLLLTMSLLLLTMSVKIVKLEKRLRRVERYISKNIQKEMHIDLKELFGSFGSMDEMIEELLTVKEKEKDDNKKATKKANGKSKHKD